MAATKVLLRSPQEVQNSLSSNRPRLTSAQPRIISSPKAQTHAAVKAPEERTNTPAESKLQQQKPGHQKAAKRDLAVVAKGAPVTKRTSQKSRPAPTLSHTFMEISRVLLVPVLAVVIACAALIALAGNRFRAETTTLELAEIEQGVGTGEEIVTPEGAPEGEPAGEIVEPESALNNALSDALALFSRDRNSELSAPRVRRAAVATSRTKSAVPQANIEDMKSKIKFISGLIAMHRPTIPNCGEVAKAIVEISTRENIDPFFIAAVISIESRFANSAVSPVGARGLMQIMPATANYLSRTTKTSALSDTHTNINLGVRYLKQLEATYRGDRTLALSAYNWGPGNVDRVKKGYARIPSSVKKYSKTIIERTKNWADHYRKAKESASSLDSVVLAAS